MTSSFDAATRRAAEDEVRSLGAMPGTVEAHVVIVDPRDGTVLAMHGGERRDGRFVEVPDLPLRALHVPGSVMKPFTIAAALEAGAITAEQRFSGENGVWSRPDGTLRDSSKHEDMSLGDVMAFSSNIGAGKIAAALGNEKLAAAYARFGFGAGGGPDFPHAARGRFAFGSASPFEAMLLAGGESGETTPFEVATAFATLVNGGVRHRPTRTHPARAGGERVLSEATARAVLPLLESVVAREDGTGTKARVSGVRVLGKTGTAVLGKEGPGATTLATFVGAFPAEAARAVVLVAVATTEAGYTGGTIAAPSFRRIVERLGEPGAGAAR